MACPFSLSVIICILPLASRYIAWRSSTSRISSARTAVVANTPASAATARTILEGSIGSSPLGLCAAVGLTGRTQNPATEAPTEMPCLYGVDSAALSSDVRAIAAQLARAHQADADQHSPGRHHRGGEPDRGERHTIDHRPECVAEEERCRMHGHGGAARGRSKLACIDLDHAMHHVEAEAEDDEVDELKRPRQVQCNRHEGKPHDGAAADHQPPLAEPR